MRNLLLITILATLVATGCGRPAAPARPPASTPSPRRAAPGPAVWRVVAVADGDTVRAIDEGKVEHRIRLAGIDAPETAQPFGTVARRRLAELALGKAATVYAEGTDRYGRTIARLEVGQVDVCRQLVAEGLAWHYRRYSRDEALAEAEAAAREARLGLWRDPAPVAPWEWRAGEAERKRQPAAR